MKKEIFALLNIAGIIIFAISCNRSSTKLEKLNDGIILNLKNGALKVQICTEKIARIVFDPERKFQLRKSLVVEKEWKPVPFEVSSDDRELRLSTKELIILINKKSGALSFSDKNGRLYLREDQEKPRQLTRARVMGEKTYHLQQNFKLSPEEGIYGLGQHQEGIMNYRNHDVLLVQENEKVSIPFLVSTNNYGILWDNYSKSKFHDGQEGTYFWSEVGEAIDYYFICGKDLDDVIRGYREITGQAPMFPRWAFGFWQSKERYRTGQELMEVASEYRQRKIPIDLIIQDWQYWGDPSQWSAMKFDEERYPRPEEMIKTLHDKYHVHFMVSIWPVLGPKTEIYKEMEKKGLLYSPVVRAGGKVYDAYSEEARKIYWKYIYEGLFSKGVDAFWMDSTEPEVNEADEKHIKQIGQTALGSIARYLNTYSLMTTKGVYEGQRSVSSDKRVVILTRSAFAGQQRYAAATWSGDIVARWDVFRNQISAGLNFCMSGIPYWTTDIGAFYVRQYGAFFDEGCNDPGYRELYVRWFQYGAFCPIFRSHGTDTPREIWRFGEPGTWAYDTLVKYDILRYRLLPYIYSLAWKVTSDGYTIMRGLPMDFSNDKTVLNIDNQFMFGPALLICPVTKQMYYGEDYINEVIPADYLFTPDGQKGGLRVEFYNGQNFEKLVTTRVQKKASYNTWVDELPEGVDRVNYSLRWTGEVLTKGAGEYEFWLTCDDGVRLWLDDRLVIDSWQAQRARNHRAKVNLEAGKKYRLRIDYFNSQNGTQMRLAWTTPDMPREIYNPNEIKSWRLYLPEARGWYDFWTGERREGGKWIEREVPIDIMPIYVRAGSIVPMGPEVQYSTEKPADPIELRIYPGEDAEFILYEDENDNYNYEKGFYALIPIKWDEKNQSLTIGEEKGDFPGKLKRRTFHLVWVGKNHGVGVEPERRPDKIVLYEGKAIQVKRN
jgi:alpha-D-xyloside xylohydrolase